MLQRVLLRVVSVLLVSANALAHRVSTAQHDYPFRNVSLPIETRLDDLLNRLTISETIGQLFMAAVRSSSRVVLRVAPATATRCSPRLRHTTFSLSCRT